MVKSNTSTALAVDYIYLGDKSTDLSFKNTTCSAVRNKKHKCIRGRNGAMLVCFNGVPVVVIGRRLRKLSLSAPEQ